MMRPIREFIGILLQLFRDGFLLEEEAEVVAAAGLRVGAAHVEAAERVTPTSAPVHLRLR